MSRPIGGIATVGLPLVVAGATVLAMAHAARRSPAAFSPPSADVAAGIGLTPNALAASGVQPSAVSGIAGAIASHDDEVEAFLDARDDVDGLVASLSAARRQFHLDPGDLTAAESIAAIEVQLAAARVELNENRDELRQVVLAQVPASLGGKLNASMSACEADAPAQCKVVARTDGEWRALQIATRQVNRAARLGVSAPAESLALVNQAETDQVVVAAKSDLDAKLSNVCLAFSMAFAND